MFDGMRVLSGQRRGRSELVMLLVNHLVEARGVEEPVDVVEDGFAGHDAQGNLPGHFAPEARRGGRDAKPGALAGADGEGGEG